MFYSNEVLTSRKYGVATVWLVATMGVKSGLKKVGKKAIIDVDVSKACSTVLAPEAPMALRLQSNLLFGIARVYAQQCGYVLTDVEAVRNKILAMLKRKGEADLLQPEGQKRAKPELLEDDPAFIPGLDLMNLNLDNLNFGQLNIDSTMLLDDPQSSLSPHSTQLTDASQQSIGGLMLPPSASSFQGGPVGGSDLFGLRGNSESGANVQPARMLEDDLFVVGDDGTMNFDDIPIRQPSAGAKQTQPSAAKDRGNENPDFHMSDQAMDDGFMPAQDDVHVDVEMPDGGLQHETSSETATAPLRHQRVKRVRIVPLDLTTELSNRQLSERNKSYMADMRAASHQKQNTKLAAIAKKNAEYWVLGSSNLLGPEVRGPLDMFSGARLFEAFTGIKLGPGGQKRAREDGDASTQNGRRVRARGEEPLSEEVGRGMSDDNNLFLMDDDYTIEQGREAPTPLDERQASSIFPWNQSAGSRRPTDPHTASASMGNAPLDKALRRASRLTSASPLNGRGMLGAAAEPDDFQLGLESDYAAGSITGMEEFELFGAAAQVDTQTAEQSQWQRATLVGESANFLDFVRTAIESADEHRVQDVDDDEDLSGTIDFETLLPPHQSRIVAAQAFLHLLTLGSRQMIQVEQEEAFGPISMRVFEG